MNEPERRIRRVRHETRRRKLTVIRRQQLAPGLLRLTFGGADLDGFTSLGFDDHIKLFVSGPSGPAMRDYTPRRYDPLANELDIEFAVHHDAGPATAWARAAQVGSELEIGGPRGSFIIEDGFDWYVMVGDEAALPAIARRLEELRADVPVVAIVSVEGDEGEIELESRAQIEVVWVHRTDGETAESKIRAIGLPGGTGYVWIAGESAWVKSLRNLFVSELHHPSEHIRAIAYWRRGDANVHEVIES